MDCCLIFYTFYGAFCAIIASMFSLAACISEAEDIALLKTNSIVYDTNKTKKNIHHHEKNPKNPCVLQENHSSEKRLPPAIIKRSPHIQWKLEKDLTALFQVEFLENMQIPHTLAVEIVTAIHDESTWNDTNATRLNLIMNRLLEIHNLNAD